MPPRWAIWQPNQVMMDDEALKEGLTFILENPTKETARAYLDWQEERAGKMQKALRLLQEVKKELAARRLAAKEKPEPAPGGPFTVLYFHAST